MCSAQQRCDGARHVAAPRPARPRPLPASPRTRNLEDLLRHLADDLGARVVVLVDPGAGVRRGGAGVAVECPVRRQVHRHDHASDLDGATPATGMPLARHSKTAGPGHRGAACFAAPSAQPALAHKRHPPPPPPPPSRPPRLWPKPNMRSLRFFTPSRKGPTFSTLPMRCAMGAGTAAGGWLDTSQGGEEPQAPGGAHGAGAILQGKHATARVARQLPAACAAPPRWRRRAAARTAPPPRPPPLQAGRAGLAGKAVAHKQREAEPRPSAAHVACKTAHQVPPACPAPPQGPGSSHPCLACVHVHPRGGQVPSRRGAAATGATRGVCEYE